MTDPKGRDRLKILEYVASFMLVGAIVYAVINAVLASSFGLKGGVPIGDIEASFVVGIIAILLFAGIAVYRRMVGWRQSRENQY